MSSTGTPLPGSYRWALVAAVIVGFQVSLAAGFDVQATANHADPPSLTGSEAALPGLGLSPLAQRQIVLAAASGHQTALESLVPWRIVSSSLLAIASGLVFVLGMRLRVTQDRRPATAQLLGIASLAAAALRSIDGAENLVIVRTVFTEVGKAIVREGVHDAEAMSAVVLFICSAASAGWTLVVVAGFVLIGNYFRSETLRAALARAEP